MRVGLGLALLLAFSSLARCEDAWDSIQTTSVTRSAQEEDSGSSSLETSEKCLGTLKNLKIHEENQNLQVSWESPTIRGCNFRHEISWAEEGTPSTSSGTQGNNIVIENVKLCTKYEIKVQLHEEGSEEILSEISANFETPSFEPKVEHIKTEVDSNSIKISWDKNQFEKECQITYSINKTFEGQILPSFTRMESNEYSLENLDSCVEYNLGVKASERHSHNISEEVWTKARTLPGQVDEFRIAINEGTTELTWKESDKPFCSKHNIYQNGQILERSYNESFYKLDGSFFCTEFGVQLLGDDGSTGDIQTKAVPGIVQDLHQVTEESTDKTITVSWNPPLDDSCVVKYIVAVGSNPPKDVFDTKFTTDNLKDSCTKFSITVQAKSETDRGEPSTITAETLKPNVINPPAIFDIYPNGDKVEAKFLPPTGQQNCVTGYRITVMTPGIVVPDITPTESPVVIGESTTGCKIYNGQIVAQMGAASESNFKGDTYTNPGIVPNRPKFHQCAPEPATLKFQWKADDYIVNMCELLNIEVHCEALEADNNFTLYPCNLREQTATKTITDSLERPPLDVEVTPLCPFTNYTCKARVTNSAGISEWSDVEKVSTLPDVPGAPTLKVITNPQSTSFTFEWDPSNVTNGIIVKYNYKITPLGPQYDIPTECVQGPLEPILGTVDGSETLYVFPEAKPYHKYEVVVNAETSAGPGDWSNKEETTTSRSAPEKPRDLSYELSLDTLTARITWKYPCVTNGPLTSFNLTYSGQPSSGTGEIHEGNSQITDLTPSDYNYDIKNIRFGYIYTVTVMSFSEVGSAAAQIQVVVDEGIPGPPILKQITKIQERSFTFDWDPPATTNGIIVEYNYKITPLGPKYDIPVECAQDLEPISGSVKESETFYTFQGANPYYEYEVVVNAATKEGPGEWSNPEKATTLSSAPEAPRYLGKKVTAQGEGENFQVQAEITWTYPCYTHGTLNHFIFTLEEVPMVETTRENIPLEGLGTYSHLTLLKPASKYKVTVESFSNSGSTPSTIDVDSLEGRPSAPIELELVETTDTTLTVRWKPPTHPNGHIINYTVSVTPVGPEAPSPSNCSAGDLEPYNILSTTLEQKVEGLKPYFNYKVTVAAETSEGIGSPSNEITVRTDEGQPGEITDLKWPITQFQEEIFKAQVYLTFKPPCSINGEFEQFEAFLNGTRVGFENHVQTVNSTIPEIVFDLKPEYNYKATVSVKTKTHESGKVSTDTFTAPSGVPGWNLSIKPPIVQNAHQATFTLDRNLFDNTNGEILYFAILLSEEFKSEVNYGYWDFEDESTWPPADVDEEKKTTSYQATAKFWFPFSDGDKDKVEYPLGDGKCETDYCNKPLTSNTQYLLKVRGLTSRGYRDTREVKFLTSPEIDDSVNLSVVLGIVFGVVGAALLLVFLFILWRRRQNRNVKEPLDDVPLIPIPVSVRQFPQHYDDIRHNFSKLKGEYAMIGAKSAEDSQTTYEAVQPHNKRKNRYTNILPFDATRVHLKGKQPEDSDYINASYIKGYSGRIEYIASQGPLENTCSDFWKMVLQENVQVIIMVAQFVEQNKEKCYKYFPNNQENMELGDDVEIRCLNELDFGWYCHRTLLVQKNMQKMTITHLQFTEWPDFGCPNGTAHMLEFCYNMRQQIKRNEGLTLIHCSAGVGRTGTLIALDILLQTINDNKDIDVFGTVMNLRRQRTKMVQTEKQYLYIHECLRDAIQSPTSITEIKTGEPIYENVAAIKSHDSFL